MASPQTEEGFTRLANELLEALLNAKLTSRQWSVVMAISRKTYGFNKKEDDMSASQIGTICAMHRVHVTETLNQLERMNVILKRPGVYGCIVSIQKNYELWIADPKEKNSDPKKVSRVSGNHYTYRVTHEATGEFYIGVRSCKCHPNQDRYKGSGNWIALVGVASLSKEILSVFDSREEAEKEEIKLIRESTGNPLMKNVATYKTSTASNPVHGVTESVQGVQEKSDDSTEVVTQDSTDSVHTKDKPKKDNKQKKAPRPEVAFKKWIENCKAEGVSPIPRSNSVFEYAKKAKIPDEFLRLHWLEFKDRYFDDDDTKYKAWTTVFKKSVRGNWYRLWYFGNDGSCILSTTGFQAKNVHEETE